VGSFFTIRRKVMSLQESKDLADMFDSLTEEKFKDFIMTFLKIYQRNPTKQKMKHLILNLPIGFFLNQSDIDKLPIDRGYGLPMKYQDLFDMIKSKTSIANLIKEKFSK